MRPTSPVFEHEAGRPLKDGQYDGMEAMLGDDILPTDWDIGIEEPPHDAWFAHVDAIEAAKGEAIK